MSYIVNCKKLVFTIIFTSTHFAEFSIYPTSYLMPNFNFLATTNDFFTFFQHYILKIFIEKTKEAPTPEIKNILRQLISLYGLWSLEKHLSTLYKGGYITGDKSAILIQETILKLCNDLKNDAVTLVDAIAMPDCVLNSVLGNSDGLVGIENKLFLFCNIKF